MTGKSSKNRMLKDVALEYQVKYTTFRRLWFRNAQRVLDKRSAQYTRQMGIDEFSVAKRHKYRTVLVDLEKHWVVTTLNGRDSVGLKGYLQTFDDKQRIVADKFHIIRMVNYALDFTRRVMQRQAKKGRKQIIFRAKHLLLKACERLIPK